MNATATDNLGIGLHRGIPAADYHRLPFCSNSRLSTLAASCPAKLRYEMDNPPEPTPALVIGSALHCLLLEREQFDACYAVAPKCDKRTNEGKGTWAMFQSIHAGKTILGAEDAVKVYAMANGIRQNPHAQALLKLATDREVSAIWEDESGLICKARFDALSTADGATFILDLKTTEDASPRGFEKSIDSFRYAHQGAFYLAGAAKLGLVVDDFVIVAVEKTPPYLTAVHRICDAALEAAGDDLRKTIELFWHCQTTSTWPGYEPRDADLPAYTHNRMKAAAAAAL